MVKQTNIGRLQAAAGGVFLLFACTNPQISSASDDGGEPQFQLSGDFELITLRRASDVAGGVDDPSFNDAAIGKKVSFGKTLSWFDGTSCSNWSLRAIDAPAVNLNDPNLADLIIDVDPGVLSENKKRDILNLEVNCDGAPIGTAVKLDDRVFVAPSPSGLTYAVFERPLLAVQIEALQRQLKDMKFYDGAITGKMDEATIASVSLYASYRGRYDVTFKRSAITENLLFDLDVVSCCSEPSPAIASSFPDYQPKLNEVTAVDYRPGLIARFGELPVVNRETFARAYVALGDLKRDALRNPGGMEQGNVALGADPEEYVPSDDELLAAELGDRLAAFVKEMSPEDIMAAWDGAALAPPSTDYRRFNYRHVDVMGSGRFFYASAPQTTVIEIPAKAMQE